MNNFLEFINKDIDGKKEQIGTLPVRTKVNKKKYNETLERMSKKYKNYKENVFKYLTVKAKNLIKLNDNTEDEELIENIKQLNGALNLLNPYNTCVEKMGFDSLLYQINCCETLKYKTLNHIVNGFLDKFELAGIILESKDFDYTCYVHQYMDSFLEVRNKGNQDYSKIAEIFEQIYWLNPELIQHIDLNFRKLIKKHSKKFDEYLNKLTAEAKRILAIKSYEHCLEKLSNAYILLNNNSKETIDDVIRLCISQEIDIEHFKEEHKVNKLAFATILGDFDSSNNEKLDRVCEELDKLKFNLIELSNYQTFESLFEEFKNQYGKIDNKDNKKNKTLLDIEIKITKAETELEKMNNRISTRKKSIFGGTLSDIEVKNLKIDSVLKAKELYDLYKSYEQEYFKDKVSKVISPNITINDILRLYNSFDYFKKVSIQKVYELNEYDEVAEMADKFDSFSGNPLNNIMEGVLLFEDNNIPSIISNKYRLSGIILDEENLSEENLDALLNKVNVILRTNIIRKSDVPMEKIWFVTKVNNYKED